MPKYVFDYLENADWTLKPFSRFIFCFTIFQYENNIYIYSNCMKNTCEKIPLYVFLNYEKRFSLKYKCIRSWHKLALSLDTRIL